MSKFNNPLDNIRVASPCNANWDEMFGDDRKRYCGACSKNVYNLSNMSRLEAENLLINSEGRLCVRYFRRADGTVLTQDCPIGWQAIKKRVSRIATAAVSMVAGLFTGIFALNLLNEKRYETTMGVMTVPTSHEMDDARSNPIQGGITPMDFDQGEVGPTIGRPEITIQPKHFIKRSQRRK
ncbi:MAG: hypothetical protein QM785_02665 [Pyrinomonadaceae bacterium]